MSSLIICAVGFKDLPLDLAELVINCSTASIHRQSNILCSVLDVFNWFNNQSKNK